MNVEVLHEENKSMMYEDESCIYSAAAAAVAATPTQSAVLSSSFLICPFVCIMFWALLAEKPATITPS